MVVDNVEPGTVPRASLKLTHSYRTHGTRGIKTCGDTVTRLQEKKPRHAHANTPTNNHVQTKYMFIKIW